MRPVDLANLEFPRLLEALSRHAASASGREACLALKPETSPIVVREELARVDELRAITEDEPAPLGDFADIRPALAISGTQGARLSGRDRRYIKGEKYTLLSRRENLTLDGKSTLRTLLAANKRLNAAYLLKESFGHISTATTTTTTTDGSSKMRQNHPHDFTKRQISKRWHCA